MTLAELQIAMDAAAERQDFEEARRLRDMIALASGGAPASELDANEVSGISRQRPGAMGLGTGQPRVEPPFGWKPPPKPDPGTSGRSRRGRK